tara:strand:- start:1648 stop:1920 length:273 start_codon:yes stop_codon:yes gene_type:complete
MTRNKIHASFFDKNDKNLTKADLKLRKVFNVLMGLVENTGNKQEDCIILAGAMLSVAKLLYFDNFNNKEASQLWEASLGDFNDLVKPTIH